MTFNLEADRIEYVYSSNEPPKSYIQEYRILMKQLTLVSSSNEPPKPFRLEQNQDYCTTDAASQAPTSHPHYSSTYKQSHMRDESQKRLMKSQKTCDIL